MRACRKIAYGGCNPYIDIDNFAITYITTTTSTSTVPIAIGSVWDKAYRYGFNGKDKDIGIDDYDFGARIYDGRIGRWLSLDKMKNFYNSISAYTFSGNCPIYFKDYGGFLLKDPQGNLIVTSNGTIFSDKSKSVTNGNTTYNITHNYEVVSIYCDNGTPIQALRYINSTVVQVTTTTDGKGNKTSTTNTSTQQMNGAVSDCHGETFTGGKLWINDDQIKTLLENDNYAQNVLQKDATGVVFNSNGEVIHSSVKKSDGTYKSDAGTYSTKDNLTLDEAAGKAFGGKTMTDISKPENVNFIKKNGKDKVSYLNTGELKNGLRYVKENDINSIFNILKPIKKNDKDNCIIVPKPTTTNPN